MRRQVHYLYCLKSSFPRWRGKVGMGVEKACYRSRFLNGQITPTLALPRKRRREVLSHADLTLLQTNERSTNGI